VDSVTFRPRFGPGERAAGIHYTGGWVDPRAGMDTEAAGKIISPLPGIEPRSPGLPARSQTPLSCTDSIKYLFNCIVRNKMSKLIGYTPLFS
jgi:hypothetical protein